MGDETQTTLREQVSSSVAATAQSQLSTAELLDYLTMRAAEVADRKISEREDRNRRRMGWTVGVFSLFGVGLLYTGLESTLDGLVQPKLEKFQATLDETLARQDSSITARLTSLEDKLDARLETVSTKSDDAVKLFQAQTQGQEQRYQALRPELMAQVELATKDALDGEISGLQGNLDDEVAYYQMTNLARELEAKPQFSAGERNSLLALLERIRATRLTAREDFRVALERIVDSFHQASQAAAIDRIEHLYEDIIEQSPGIIVTLVDHYALRVVSGPTNGELVDLHARNRLSRYLQLVNARGLRVVWELLLDGKFDLGGETRAANRRALGVLDANEEELMLFLRKLLELSVPGLWSKQVDIVPTEAALVAAKTRALYATEIKLAAKNISPQEVVAAFEKPLRSPDLPEEVMPQVLAFVAEIWGENPAIDATP